MDLRKMQNAERESRRKVTREKLEFGSLVITELTEEDGLIFKDGRHHKIKRLVIVGVDRVNEVYFGSVLVNTKPSPKAQYSDEYRSAQYLLSYDNYPEFLRYDSYLDCGELLAIPFGRLERGEYYGMLTDDDQRLVMDLLETTPTIRTKDKKRFGIMRR